MQVFPALSSEVLEKLRVSRPGTLDEASQLQGMTPESVLQLFNHMKRRRRVGESNRSSPLAVMEALEE